MSPGLDYAALSSESGSWSWGRWVPSDELHHAARPNEAWIGWHDQLRASKSNENALKCSKIRGLCGQSVGYKPENYQCDKLNHALTKSIKTNAGWNSRVVITTDDGGAARLSGRYPQFVHVSRVDKRLIEFLLATFKDAWTVPILGDPFAFFLDRCK